MSKKTRIILFVVGAVAVLILGFRLFFGIFVIQPIGAVPEGVTIIYWRAGLNLPFIASADSLLEDSGAGVSLLGRGMILAGVAKPIMNRKVLRLGYSETLYLYSTHGKKYER